MARPLATSDGDRSGPNGNYHSSLEETHRAALQGLRHELLGEEVPSVAEPGSGLHAEVGSETLQELERLREENGQLRALCAELEQALQEAAQNDAQWNERAREYDSLLEE